MREPAPLQRPYTSIGLLTVTYRNTDNNRVEQKAETAFLIGDGTFALTAAHTLKRDERVFISAQFEAPEYKQAKVLWWHAHPQYVDVSKSHTIYDMAVVKLDAKLDDPLELRYVTDHTVIANETRIVAGYVGETLNRNTAIIARWPQDGNLVVPYQYALNTTVPGMSGGPVFASDSHEVDAVISGSTNTHCVAAPIVYGSGSMSYEFIDHVMKKNQPPGNG